MPTRTHHDPAGSTDPSATDPSATDPAATDAAVELHEITMLYNAKRGRTVRAVEDVSLRIPQGEFVSIVGPSGCGKSTLLKIIMGLVRQSAGEIRFGAGPTTRKNKLGMVFQQALLLPWRTVEQNLMISQDLQPRGGRDVGEVKDRVAELLAMLGLTDFAQQYPNELSGGMQQRVGIGRALLHDPQILLMDEPFGALDAMTRDQMGLDLLDIWERDRKTVLFVTHSIPEAVLLSDLVVVMTPRPGRVADVIEVPLERPRRLEQINTPEFGAIAGRIRGLLNSENSAH